jgi:hypothetical protein
VHCCCRWPPCSRAGLAPPAACPECHEQAGRGGRGYLRLLPWPLVAPGLALRWEEHKERTRRDLLASAHKREALAALLASFLDVTAAAFL